MQDHEIWSHYTDVCREGAGLDYSWSIGSELRQQQLHLIEMQDPHLFRNILIDDTKRRSYVVDADVVVIRTVSYITKPLNLII